MEKKLYLHLGLHKTSSSSFQATCKANASFLSDQGITYPLFKCKQTFREDISNHSLPIFSLFSGKAAKYHINIRRGITDVAAANAEYMSQLDQILASSEKVILSGEDIGVLNDRGLNRLKASVLKHNYSIIPFALVRDPYNFMNSAYQQMIKSGNYNSLISLGSIAESKVDNDLTLPNRNRAIQSILNVFRDSAQFYPFRKACEYNGDPVRFILEYICGVKNISTITMCRKNESRSNIWTRVQNQLNKVYPAIINGKPNLEHKKLKKNLYRDLGDKFILTESEFNMIRDPFKIHEEIMHSLLGDDFMEKSYTFSDTISNEIIDKVISDYPAFAAEQ
jgi:hypothetical protein